MESHESTNVIAEFHLTKRGVGGYRVDVYRDKPEGYAHTHYYIKGDGYAMDALMNFIGHHRYTIEYAYNSIYTPVYILHERTW